MRYLATSPARKGGYQALADLHRLRERALTPGGVSRAPDRCISTSTNRKRNPTSSGRKRKTLAASSTTSWINWPTGVQRIYGVVGDAVLPLISATAERQATPRFVPTRHEEAAALMAKAEAILTADRVCLADLGAGAPRLLDQRVGRCRDGFGPRARHYRPTRRRFRGDAAPASDRPTTTFGRSVRVQRPAGPSGRDRRRLGPAEDGRGQKQGSPLVCPQGLLASRVAPDAASAL